MTTRFLMLMPWGRVGSNLLFDILRQQARMKLNNEKFNQLRTAEEQRHWFKEFYEIGATFPSSEYIGSKQNTRAVVNMTWLRETVIGHGIRVVRLRRDDLLRAALSQIRAEQYADYTETRFGRRQWAVRAGDSPLPVSVINPVVLQERIKIMREAHGALLGLFRAGEVLDIEYRQIENDLGGVVHSLTEYLSVPSRSFKIRFEKATPQSLRQAIENFDEVKEHLLAAGLASPSEFD